ncbi:MAG: hypothetical protein ORO03_06730 [Alphaproteobacteria bacterium]|nr:hypothetical protein [Alphaproteobacteria bacterium]
MYRIVGLALLALGVTVGAVRAAAPSQAESEQTLPQFLNWLNRPEQQAGQVLALNRAEPAGLVPPCAGLEQVGMTGWMAVEPIVWSQPEQQPTAGSWIERFSADRCGQTVVRRLLVSVDRRGQVHYSGLIPGETLVNYTLEMRARGVIIRRAQERLNCRDPRRLVWLNTAVTKQLGSNSGANHWRERWSGIACGQNFVIDLDFAPNPRNLTDPKEVTVTIVE